jgi:hypothetical protein
MKAPSTAAMMRSLGSLGAEHCFASFEVHRIAGLKTLWLDADALQDAGLQPPIRDEGEFAEAFSFAVSRNECFESLPFDTGDCRIYYGERYGGTGVGDNGGGGRCGNFGGFQVKGVGRNPLVGAKARAKKWHSYGGLNARDAIYETIYSQVLAGVLPVGTARIYGVLLTAADAAYEEFDEATGRQRTGWGALLVREPCLRPGHFVRAPTFQVGRGLARTLAPDTIRVRSTNQALLNSLGGARGLVGFLGVFLRNCASQMAFARVMRLAHGCVSASNLCFDGRWIDLTNTTFIGGGENVGGAPPFYEEAGAIGGILSEVCYTMCRFNGIDLSFGGLLNYYQEQLVAYTRLHLLHVFALEDWIPEDEQSFPPYLALAEQVFHVFNSGRTLINRWPRELAAEDPVISLIEGLFCSLVAGRTTLDYVRRMREIPGFDAAAAASSFAQVVGRSRAAPGNTVRDYRRFAIKLALTSLRRALLPEFFFKGRLDQQIEAALAGEVPADPRKLVDESIAVARWVFPRDECGRVWLFRGPSCSVAYDARVGSYELMHEGDGTERLATAAECSTELQRLPEAAMTIQGYDFRKRVIRILRVATTLEALPA